MNKSNDVKGLALKVLPYAVCILVTAVVTWLLTSQWYKTPNYAAVIPTETPTPTATVMPTAVPTPTQAAWPPTPIASPVSIEIGKYPLSGQKYTAWINGIPDETGRYDAVWTDSGWLWQPKLPPQGQRVGFTMSITIEEGYYSFAGVSCRLHLDTTRNGKGSDNPITVAYGNGLTFKVDTTDNGQAWAVVVCDTTDVTGYSIQYVGPLP